MAELIYSVDQVFGSYLKAGQKYNIPEYQRGYKWSSQQINQLLDDINGFNTGGDEDIFYCLQNITLVPFEAENKLNIVDGQQRLTTITLLLSYLQETERLIDKLNYAVRVPSNHFIQKVISNENEIQKSIINSKNFEEFLKNSETDFDYQDIYFMYSAIRTINKWFTDRSEEQDIIDESVFKNKLLKNVKLIINSIKDVTEQELFMNLNAEKVQLDGSDLVRAILITRVSKQEMDEYDSAEIKDVVRLNERRIRIGWELDEINTWWSKNSVKEYFSDFSNLKTGEKETIKFDDSKHPINLLYKLWADKNKKKEIKLALFEAKNSSTKNALDLYKSITLLHRTLKDWFDDREIYHYLGFLMSRKSISLVNIFEQWDKSSTTREEFVNFLIGKVKTYIFGNEPNDETEETGLDYWLYKIKDYDSENPTYWKGSSELQKILILLDVIEHAKKRENGIPLPFLKPKYFKNFKEDEEHIYPSTPQEITEKKFKDLSNPMESIQNYISKLNEGYEKDKIIKWSISTEEWNKFSDEEKNEKLSLLKSSIHKNRPINSIGNLALLHLSINRGFGNDYYSDKREIVINNTEIGYYVRQHTLKVFVKQTNTLDLNNWTMIDIKNNANKTHKIMLDFFALNRNEENNE